MAVSQQVNQDGLKYRRGQHIGHGVARQASARTIDHGVGRNDDRVEQGKLKVTAFERGEQLGLWGGIGAQQKQNAQTQAQQTRQGARVKRLA